MKLSFKIYFVVVVLFIASVVAILYFYPKPIVYNESFEQDFGGWIESADVPLDPNNPGHMLLGTFLE